MTSLYDRMEAKLDGHPILQNISAIFALAWIALFLPIFLIAMMVGEVNRSAKEAEEFVKARDAKQRVSS